MSGWAPCEKSLLKVRRTLLGVVASQSVFLSTQLRINSLVGTALCCHAHVSVHCNILQHFAQRINNLFLVWSDWLAYSSSVQWFPGRSEWAEQLADANWPAWWETQHPSKGVCAVSEGRSRESLVLRGLRVRAVDVGCHHRELLNWIPQSRGSASQRCLPLNDRMCSHVVLFRLLL